MDYAVVSTKKSSLKVYSTSKANDKFKVGTISTGSMVEILDHRTVNNVEWVKVNDGTISGWAILTHPSINYPLLQPPVSTMSLRASGKNLTGYNAAVKRQSSSSSVKTVISTANSGGSSATSGEVPDAKNNKNWTSFKSQHRSLSSIDKFEFPKEVAKSTHKDTELNRLKNLAKYVQNDKLFPVQTSYDKSKGRYSYDYEQNYHTNEFINAMGLIKESLNIPEESSVQLYERYSRYYNRFKVPTLDDVLTRTFAHVFFTRPDCNIIFDVGSGKYQLAKQLEKYSRYTLEFKNNPETLLQLSSKVGMDHDFMMLPSNRVTSFECRDRTLTTDTYGKTKHGRSIAYGKKIDGNGANEVSISFTDDRNLHLFKMHEIWVDYISKVSRGTLRPLQGHLANKVLDYACSAYYIVCAENGEDIIYWSKLYGVFPTNIPDSIMTWTKSQYITNPELSITYQYSFQKPWDPAVIAEFNLNSTGSKHYLETYNNQIMSTGNTWVGAPYIELIKDSFGRTIYKLRFRKS